MSISLDEDVVKKVNIMAELTDKTPNEVVNDALRDQLDGVENIPRKINHDKIHDMLDHDKPEGDDILDNFSRIGEECWD
jgi:predicted transcriptional regulator